MTSEGEIWFTFFRRDLQIEATPKTNYSGVKAQKRLRVKLRRPEKVEVEVDRLRDGFLAGIATCSVKWCSKISLGMVQ